MKKIDSSIILEPIITEKSGVTSQKENTFCFKVAREANKIEIAQAITSLFKVKVKRVNTLSRIGKIKRRGKQVGHTPFFKKAFVTLEAGQKIQLLEGLF